MKVWGIVGASQRARSELIERLAAECAGRGVTVSTLRQAPPDFDVDDAGKDSHRHRMAGASEVVLSSRKRWALMHELRGQDEPGIEDLLAQFSPVDLVLVDGFAESPHPKIETLLDGDTETPGGSPDPTVRAIACADARNIEGRPRLPLADTRAIADFILTDPSP